MRHASRSCSMTSKQHDTRLTTRSRLVDLIQRMQLVRPLRRLCGCSTQQVFLIRHPLVDDAKQ